MPEICPATRLIRVCTSRRASSFIVLPFLKYDTPWGYILYQQKKRLVLFAQGVSWFSWAEQDSNLCRLAPTILQTASFSHSDIDPYEIIR
jgi:hypothetical protein